MTIFGMGHAPDATAELRQWWKYYNRMYLSGALRPPVFCVAQVAPLGSWDRATGTLTISALHLQRDPWLGVMETLRHEMAHQYADQVLGGGDEPPHGPKFREACRLLRVTAKAQGTGDEVTFDRTASEVRAGVLDKVHKLLSLSSSPNQHEAEAALRKARELLLRHNISDAELGQARTFGKRWLGVPKTRLSATEVQLSAILTEFFFVESLWATTYDVLTGKDMQVLEIYGTEANLAMAEYVYGYLHHVLDQLWRDYEARHGKQNQHERRRYAVGVLRGFRDKLRTQEQVLRTAHALVWSGDSALEEFYRWHNPRIRKIRSGGLLRTSAFEEGLRDGQRVTLRKPVSGEPPSFGGFLTTS